jgi:predicted AAA+ superfamily ATPase
MYSRILKIPLNQSFFMFGPRQTGKTWLLRESLPAEHTRVYNLLLSEEYMRLSSAPELFRQEILSRPKDIRYIFVDEVQRVPALLDEIHHILESPSAPLFALTGSSARKLKRSQANLLGGRAWTLRLYPLTHLEIGDSFVLDRVLNFGSLPKVCGVDDDDAKQLLRSYVETYLKEEIEAEALVRSVGTFIRFLFQAGHESGSVINYTTIAREVGASSPTVKQYFQILEDTLVGQFLPAFSKASRKRLAAHPKFFLFDCGVQRALTKKLNVPLEPQTREYGMAFEHFIINECMRLSDYKNLDYEFSYFRTEHKAEVDLIIENPRGETLAVEIKSSSNPAAPDFKPGLESFAKVVPRAKLLCVCNARFARTVDNVTVMPWMDFLREYF